MKKIFSTVAMAVVAFTAVVSMSSCQNDSPSAFNAAPQVTPTQTTTSVQTKVKSDSDYAYQASINADLLDYFDITITKANGAELSDFSFTKATKIANTPVMITDNIKFKSNAQGVCFNATVKPKANWKDLVAAHNLKRLVKSVKLVYTYKGLDGSYYANPTTYNEFTDESMQGIADEIAADLNLNGSVKVAGSSVK